MMKLNVCLYMKTLIMISQMNTEKVTHLLKNHMFLLLKWKQIKISTGAFIVIKICQPTELSKLISTKEASSDLQF